MRVGLIRQQAPGARLPGRKAAAAKLRPHASLPQTLARLYAEPTADAGWLAQRSAALEAGISRDDWPEDQLELTLLRLARGDRAGALAALQEAVEAGWRDRAYLQTSALFQPLAAEPGIVGSGGHSAALEI